jgi:ribosomal protein S12 methylthiotransferase
MDFWNGAPVKTDMKTLCEKLGEMGMWVRLHYVYPYPSVDKVIPLMSQGKLLPYLDIPFQHASPKILKAMKRPGQAEKVLERIQKWRDICPEIVIRSTFIVGFPGETEEDFQMLLDWLEEAQLDRVGCFKYSAVKGAKANEIEGQVDEDVKEERYARFMEKQQVISTNKLKAKIGTTMSVLIDEVDEEGAIGRTFADAPEIDGMVYLNGETTLEAGQLVDVKIDHSDEYDLWASTI